MAKPCSYYRSYEALMPPVTSTGRGLYEVVWRAGDVIAYFRCNPAQCGREPAWLLTRQLTMVAPWRLMVQVVLLPLSMGTTGTWHAILVTPTPAAHWSSVAAAADCFYYVRLECHLVARRDTSSHPDKDPGPGPDAPHSTHTFIVSHTQTYLIMPLSVLIPCRRHFRAPKF